MMIACSGCTPPRETQTDDAKKRALVERVSNEVAVERYTYPESKGKDGRSHPTAPDFFAGMDVIIDHKSYVMPDALLVPPKVDGAEPGQPVRATLDVKSPSLEPEEVVGRNTWMAWCAGNEGFWDLLCTDSLGFIDLLKLVDSRQRNLRFANTGMINEPGMEQAKFARPDEHGLWLDAPAREDIREWREEYVRQTFEAIQAGKHKSQIGLRRKDVSGAYEGTPLYRGEPDAFKKDGYRYPSQYLSDEQTPYGSGTGLRDPYGVEEDDDPPGSPELPKQPSTTLDEVIPPPDLYGLSSGVLGLRLFPNPYFDKAANDHWDVDRYYNDPAYYNDPDLIRPYRVGMSCAFCHASFHPLKPPRDLNNPRWENISGNIGAQYLSMRATFGNQLTPDQFVYHLLESQPRGTIDTSLIASDNINNPNTMNAVFGLPQRAFLSLRNPQERLSKDSSRLPSLWKHPDPSRPGDGVDVVPEKWVKVATDLDVVDEVVHSNDNPRHVPRILLDGSDTIGASGALARVYLNIGSYWEQWNELHQVVVGFTEQRPFRLADCKEYSVYWNATEKRVPGLRDYFLKITPTMPLLSTEGGDARIKPMDKAETKKLKQQAKREQRDFKDLLASVKAQRVDVSQLARGRKVFARNCIVCHSSIQPESTEEILGGYSPNDAFHEVIRKRLRPMFPDEITSEEMDELNDLVRNRLNSIFEKRLPGKEFEKLVSGRKSDRNTTASSGEFWEHDPDRWLDDVVYQLWAEGIVEQPKFWTENYLSTDYRIPINLVKTNSARAMATNAMTGHMWEDFTSESYRELPSPGVIEFFNPYKGEDGEMDAYTPRHINPNTGERDSGGGPGYYRVPSLMSIWATAPFLHNNSLGLYNNDPSVEGRLIAFDDAIRKMFWPEKRLESSSYNEATAGRLKRDRGLIWRTTEETFLAVDSERVPSFAHRLPLVAKLHQYHGLRWLHDVQPLWLPSTILIAGALLILLLGTHERKRLIAYALLASALLAGVVLWWGQSYSDIKWGGWLSSIRPWMLPVLTLVFVAVVLWLRLSRRWTRFSGYAMVFLGLLVGTVVYFNAGGLGDLRIGPIPAGTPVNLLANFNSEADRGAQIQSVRTLVAGLAEIESRQLDTEATRRVMTGKIAPALMEVNKCPDFVMDKGHYFPWFDSMTDEDKNALIELLKTL